MIEPRREGKSELLCACDKQQRGLEDADTIAGRERALMRLLQAVIAAALDEPIDICRGGRVVARRRIGPRRVNRTRRTACCNREEQNREAHWVSGADLKVRSA